MIAWVGTHFTENTFRPVVFGASRVDPGSTRCSALLLSQIPNIPEARLYISACLQNHTHADTNTHTHRDVDSHTHTCTWFKDANHQYSNHIVTSLAYRLISGPVNPFGNRHVCKDLSKQRTAEQRCPNLLLYENEYLLFTNAVISPLTGYSQNEAEWGDKAINPLISPSVHAARVVNLCWNNIFLLHSLEKDFKL